MPTKIAEFYAKISADNSSLKQGLQESKSGLQGLGGAFSSLGLGAVASMATLAGAVALASKGFKMALEGAAEEETSLSGLSATITSMGLESEISAARIRSIGESMQENTTFTHEAYEAASKYFMRIEGFDPSNLQGMMQTLADFAAGSGQSLESASEQVARALETGQVRSMGFSAALRKQVMEMIAAGDQAGALALIMDTLNSKYGGQAVAQLDTYNGSTQALKNSWGELWDTIGTGLVGPGKDFNTWLKGNLDTTTAAVAAENLNSAAVDYAIQKKWGDTNALHHNTVAWTANSKELEASKQEYLSWANYGLNWANSITEYTEYYKEMTTEVEKGNSVIEMNADIIKFATDWTQKANDYDKKRTEILSELHEAEKQGYVDWDIKGTKIQDLQDALSELDAQEEAVKDNDLWNFMKQGMEQTNPDMLWNIGLALGNIDEKAYIAYVNMRDLMEYLNGLPKNVTKTFIMEVIAQFKMTGSARPQTAAPEGFHWEEINGTWMMVREWAGGMIPNRAGGGPIGSGAFVGDAPGGGMTPYTEFVERLGPDKYYVHNAKATRAMVNSGLLRPGMAGGGMMGSENRRRDTAPQFQFYDNAQVVFSVNNGQTIDEVMNELLDKMR